MTGQWKYVFTRNHRFFLKNLAIFLLSILVPLIILEYVILAVVSWNIQSIIDTNNTNLLKQSMYSVEAMVTDLEYLSLSMGENPRILKAMQDISRLNTSKDALKEQEKEISDFLAPVYMAKPYINSVYIYLSNDKNLFIAGADGGIDIAYYQDVGWYTHYFVNQKIKGKPFWSKRRLVFNTIINSGNMELITLSQPFRSENGVLMLNVYKDYLDTKMHSLTYYREQKLIMLNEDDEIMFLSHPKAPLLTTDIKAILDCEKSIMKDYLLEGEKFHINIIRSSVTGWTCLSLIPSSSLSAVDRQIGLFINSMFIVAILVCAILFFFNALRLTNNLTRISHLLELARQGITPPNRQKKIGNEYDQILEEMLEVFITQNNLKQQLVEKKHEARVLEISALHSQISPHFLFNTLQSIFWMSFKQDGSHNPICEMIENMSAILDYILNDEETFVPIVREIDIAKSYIAIQKLRHETAIETIWDYGDWISPYHSIKLLLQPLLENSLIHGMKRMQGFTLRIRVRIRDLGDEIQITIADNGAGIPHERLQKIRELLNSENDEGYIGIYNLNRRLVLTFGEDYNLHIASKENMGTRIRIRLPKLPLVIESKCRALL
jgi:two-component system sensor histidine kinase YesM